TGAITLIFNSNFNFGATSDISGVAGSAVSFIGGTQQINGTFTVPNLIVGDAQTTFNIPLNLSTLKLLGTGVGILSSGNTTNISGLFTWNAGTLAGGGVVNANGGIAFGTALTQTLDKSTLNLPSGQTANSGLVLSIQNGGIFN